MKKFFFLSAFAFIATMITSCASMGTPDGGRYDEEPPVLLKASPDEHATNCNDKKITLTFDEYIKLENASEKVVVSPPQVETPEIKAVGKKIVVELKDTLKKNTTYTIDFADAILDNNEGNPMGDYAYTFSTGNTIDTMQISGHVVEASNLEPIKGILVGLQSDTTDTAFTHKPFDRVSRTDSRGHFVIKGIAPGHYRVYALNDMNQNFMFDQKSEKIAFNHDIIVPSSKPDIRPDTVWTDSIHYRAINLTPYTHYMPDDIVLAAFTEAQTQQYMKKIERDVPTRFTVTFGTRTDSLPKIHGLNFNENNAFIIDKTSRNDSITYWIKDSLIYNLDTLQMAMTYLHSDSLGNLVPQTDTLELASKKSREQLQKEYKKKVDEWVKQQKKEAKKQREMKDAAEAAEEDKSDKKKKKEKDNSEPEIDPSTMPKDPLAMKLEVEKKFAPNKNISVTFEEPLAKLDTSAIHLKQFNPADSTWVDEPFLIKSDKENMKNYFIYGEWKPEEQYTITIDSAAFVGLYGNVSQLREEKFTISKLDEFSTLFVHPSSVDSTFIVQLINSNEKIIDEGHIVDGKVSFFYIEPGKYYLRGYFDRNHNKEWDPGCYERDEQAEGMRYFSGELNLKAMWEYDQDWDVNSRRLDKQKPSVITKQKPDKEKTIKSRNAERDRQNKQ